MSRLYENAQDLRMHMGVVFTCCDGKVPMGSIIIHNAGIRRTGIRYKSQYRQYISHSVQHSYVSGARVKPTVHGDVGVPWCK